MVKHEGATIEISGKAPGSDVAVAERETHRAGHRLAAHWRQRYLEEDALGFAPYKRHHARSLPDWVDNPLENE